MPKAQHRAAIAFALTTVWALAAGCGSTAAPSALQRGTTAAPAALEVATGLVGKSNLGRLVLVRGRIHGSVGDDRPYGWKLYVDDGSGQALVFIATNTGIDVSRFQEGQQVAVTGVCSQFADHYEIQPRTQGDLQIVSGN